MAKKIALVGSPSSIKAESKKLSQMGFESHQILHIPGEPTAADLLKRIQKDSITHVVCIETRNGQTGYWISEIQRLNKEKKLFITVFGINILPHPQRVEPKSFKFLKQASCVKEIFSKKPVQEKNAA